MNNVRAVINTSVPSFEEEGTKTFGDLKRQMVLMEEENIKLFNEEKSNEDSQKTFQNSTDFEVVFFNNNC